MLTMYTHPLFSSALGTKGNPKPSKLPPEAATFGVTTNLRKLGLKGWDYRPTLPSPRSKPRHTAAPNKEALPTWQGLTFRLSLQFLFVPALNNHASETVKSVKALTTHVSPHFFRRSNKHGLSYSDRPRCH